MYERPEILSFEPDSQSGIRYSAVESEERTLLKTVSQMKVAISHVFSPLML
jgi:hypothetical protein